MNTRLSTDYWPSAVRVCGFWFLPKEWQFSCKKCKEISELVSAGHLDKKDELCSDHVPLQSFLKTCMEDPLVFIGLSSVGRQVHYNLLSTSLTFSPKKFRRILVQHK